MTLKAALAQLESLGNERMRAQNTKNGAGDNQFGVKLGDLRVLAKEIKRMGIDVRGLCTLLQVAFLVIGNNTMQIMTRVFSLRMLAVCTMFLHLGGTARAQGQADKYVDDKYDFSITVASPWNDARLQDYAVPGVARAAFSRPGGSSIVVFVQEPGKAFEPRFLVDESAKAIERNLGATVRAKEVRSVAGKKAMWLIIEGNGTGGAIDGKGAVKTSQHWVAIPREKDVVVALLTSPTTEFAENQKSFEESMKTLVVGGKQTAAQSESK